MTGLGLHGTGSGYLLGTLVYTTAHFVVIQNIGIFKCKDIITCVDRSNFIYKKKTGWDKETTRGGGHNLCALIARCELLIELH